VDDHRELLAELELDVGLHDRLMAAQGAVYRDMIAAQADRPARMAYFDRAVHDAHGARVAEIVAAQRQGRKMVGTFCIYVPEEIILAAGGIPVALCGGTAFSIPYAERSYPRDICPLLKSTLGLALADICPFGPLMDLAVGETTCDAKKKVWDRLSRGGHFHVIELPQKKNERTQALWRAEVCEFAERMEDLAGVRLELDALRDAVGLMNRKRRLLQRLNALRRADPPPISGLDALVVMQVALIDDAERFCRALESLLAELEERARQGISPFAPGTPRVLMAGCPSVMGNWKVHHLIEASGAAVVCDESCTGTRYFTHQVEADGAGRDDLLEAIADRYFRIDCSCFTPNTERVERVVELARECAADAVVQYILQYCHTYNIEAMRVDEALSEAGIPTLKIETDYSQEDAGQLRTRIEALLESLNAR
jgi:benzoyl-CoA reductase/2-hydroxyglutaryl-CoA dehydratase subunit BcrC/BadD/HgdB